MRKAAMMAFRRMPAPLRRAAVRAGTPSYTVGAVALLREVAEEIGVALTASELPVPVAAVNPRVRRVDLVYLLDAPADARPQQEDEAEVRRVGWFAADRLPDVSEPTLEILRAVRLL